MGVRHLEKGYAEQARTTTPPGAAEGCGAYATRVTSDVLDKLVAISSKGLVDAMAGKVHRVVIDGDNRGKATCVCM